MKKNNLIVVVLAATMCAGCSVQDLMFWKKKAPVDEQVPAGTYELQPEVKGGSLEQKKAIYETINNKPICNQNGKSTAEIFPENQPTLSEDDGDGLKLTTKQVIGENTVALTWDIDKTQTYFGDILKSDDAHDIVEIAYQGHGQPDGTFTWKLGRLECGEAVCEDANIVYTAKTKNEEYKHDNVRIADIYKITNEEKIVKNESNEVINKWPSTFDIIDYDYDSTKTYSPYFRTNNPDAKEKQYLYYNVPGKVIYKAPDGNWALLADGKNVLEFYAGSGTALNDKNWPNLAAEYVKLSGNMGQYCGNVQLGFITKVLALKDSEKAALAEPADYRNLTEAFLSYLNVDGYTAQRQAVEFEDGGCLSNSLAKVTGTLVANSIKDKNGDAVTNIDAMSSGARYTFDLKVGNETLTVAYDYHTDKEGKVGLFNAMKTALKAGGQMTIKGTMRYSGNNSGPFISEGNNGVWNIVPFLTEHIA